MAFKEYTEKTNKLCDVKGSCTSKYPDWQEDLWLGDFSASGISRIAAQPPQ